MNNFSKNLKHLRVLKQRSQEQLAEDCKLTRSRISSYEEGRADPPIEALLKFSNYFELPIDVLIKNDISLTQDSSFIQIGKHRVLFPILVDDDNENVIEVVPIKSTAGYLEGYDDPEYIEQLSKMKLPFIPTGKHRAFPIKGDSMTPLKDGAFVVAKYIESFDDVKDSSTYIILTRDDGMTYKRVYNREETLLLKPDNPNYQEYEVSKGDVLEVWEFTCSINTKEYDEDELKISSISQMFNQLGVELRSLNKQIKE